MEKSIPEQRQAPQAEALALLMVQATCRCAASAANERQLRARNPITRFFADRADTKARSALEVADAAVLSLEY